MRKMTMKQYVDSRFKRIEDSINNCANGKDIDQIKLLEDNITVEEISAKTKKLLAKDDTREKINPQDILEDSTHRFMTDVEKEEIKEKMISKTELEVMERDITNNLKISMNQVVDNIINNKGATSAINKLSKEIAKNKSIVDLFKNLVDEEELKEHLKDSSHITEEDRVALNLLLKFINNGFADWKAKKGEANYIKNKPSALPAKGGNANTVGGYKPEELINKQVAKCIIGINNSNGYTKNDVNVYLDKDTVNTLSDCLCANSLTHIREGYYKVDKFNMPVCSNISGVGISTQIDGCTVDISNNSKLHDIYFTNSDIIIDCNESEITDVVFKKCNITFKASRSIIKNCRFIDCAFNMNVLSNSIIRDNILTGMSNKLEYYGGNNIISNLYI